MAANEAWPRMSLTAAGSFLPGSFSSCFCCHKGDRGGRQACVLTYMLSLMCTHGCRTTISAVKTSSALGKPTDHRRKQSGLGSTPFLVFLSASELCCAGRCVCVRVGAGWGTTPPVWIQFRQADIAWTPWMAGAA